MKGKVLSLREDHVPGPQLQTRSPRVLEAGSVVPGELGSYLLGAGGNVALGLVPHPEQYSLGRKKVGQG